MFETSDQCSNNCEDVVNICFLVTSPYCIPDEELKTDVLEENKKFYGIKEIIE